MKQILADNLKKIHERIHRACDRARRSPAEVKLVAVTKYAPPECVRALIELGQLDIGESRVQELTYRAALCQEWFPQRFLGATSRPQLQGTTGLHSSANNQAVIPRWHMIGHLQRNKVRTLLPWVSMIHSVDSLRLAEELDSESGKLAKRTDILLEVNAANELSKQGVAVAAATHLAEQIFSLGHLNLRGLMAMAPLTDNEELIRRTFERVRELFDEMTSQRIGGPNFRELSIGMSNDFEQAIDYGATIVRIGSALFEGLEFAPQPDAEVDADPALS